MSLLGFVAAATPVGAPAQCSLQWIPYSVTGTVHELLTLSNGDVLIGGAFTAVEGVAANNIARYDGNSWSALGAGRGAAVAFMSEFPNGDIVAVSNDIARWDGAAWQLYAPNPPLPMDAFIALPNGNLAVGALDWTLPPFARGTILLFDGSSWQTIGAGFGHSHNPSNSWVKGLGVLPNGDLIAAGWWAWLLPGPGGYAEVARWDGASWHPHPPGGIAEPESLFVAANGDVIVGDDTRFYRTDGTSWLWAAGSGPKLSFAELPNGDIVAAGPLDPSVLPPWLGTERWDGSSSVPLGFAASNLAVQRNGHLFVDDQRLTTSCPGSAATIATACAGSAGPVVLVADTLPWTGSTHRSTATGFAPSAFAVLLVGFTSPNLPLSTLHPAGLPGCAQLAEALAIQPTFPHGGVARHELAIPSGSAFVGVQLFEQFLQAEVDTLGVLTALSGSNALQLTIGAF